MYEEVLDEKYLDTPRHYANEELIRCELLSRYLIVGSTASMKTNTDIVDHARAWTVDSAYN